MDKKLESGVYLIKFTYINESFQNQSGCHFIIVGENNCINAQLSHMEYTLLKENKWKNIEITDVIKAKNS